MSFVAEILNSQKDVELCDIDKKQLEITTHINKIKKEIAEFLQNRYVEFEPISNEDEQLMERCNELSAQMEILVTQVTDITQPRVIDALQELNDLKRIIEESRYGLEILSELLKVHKTYRNFIDYFDKTQYIEAAKCVVELENLIENPHNDIEYLDIFDSLRHHTKLSRINLISSVTETFKTSIELINNKDIIQIKIDLSEFDNLQNAFIVLIQMNANFECFSELSDFLMKNVFKTVIDNKSAVDVVEKNNSVLLNVKILDNVKPSFYGEVLKNLLNVFEFLENYLNIVIDNNKSVLSLLGNQIGDRFSTMLVESCFIELIPSTPSEMENFDSIRKEIEQFKIRLNEYQFLDEKNRSFDEFLDSVEIHYANKICTNMIKTAESIMKKDLHNMTEVEISETMDHSVLKCQISTNVIELETYVRNGLDLIKQDSEKVSKKIVSTIEQMICLYYTLVPQHHKKMLETIPQQIALFYNNCMYLAYSLNKLETEYNPKLKELNMEILHLDDVLCRLRSTGKNMFEEQLKVQKKQMLDIIKDSGLATLGQVPELDGNTEKSIRQCLRQLELLQTVWKKVLPVNVYDASLGELLNTLVEDLIRRVLSVEDISATAATQLVSFYTLVLQRAPKVFTEPKEIHKHVNLWMKLQEIIFLLEAKLADIESRWADGKGPLAVEFKPQELKNIIRALFQNTNRRAALLNKIK
ncbi:centromere/kinetochore protein zw10 homolog [Chrysoperla carnea]|uniref:centromere/kinetochore protein zw10 homolog n=1 Tax=Chrysoperla carnea TaxID=189513 RepID=UPI001D06DD92|nr:centromere/kinetochore protein zw10 homolog [Chrysoperla carnea]